MAKTTNKAYPKSKLNDPFSLIAIINTDPANPNRTPTIFFVFKLLLKNNEPIISVKTGVVLFKIPATELLILVSAKANKNGGNPLPNNPIISIGTIFFVGNCHFRHNAEK